MERFGADKEAKEVIWGLTDHCLLWDLILLEQRIVWATSGTIISYATAFRNINSYSDKNGVRSYRPVLRAQFEKLIGEVPFLSNDIVGRRVFREKEFDSPCISAPKRVLARDNIHFKERLYLFVPMIEGWKKYGPACIGLEVQGAIANYYQQQRNEFPLLPGTSELYKEESKRLAKILKSLNGSNALGEIKKFWGKTMTCQEPSQPVEIPEHLRRSDTEDDDGYAKRHKLPPITPEHKEQLKELKRTYEKSTGQTQDNRFSKLIRLCPLQDDGDISLEPNHWGEILPPTGLLRDWVDDCALKQLLNVSSVNKVTLSHEIFPYLKSIAAEYAERRGIPLVTSSDKKRQFLVLRIPDLSFLCYLRTHNEHEFLHDTGRDNTLQPLRDFIGYDHLSGKNLSTGSLWNSETLIQDLKTLCPASNDDHCTLANTRYLPSGTRYSADYWERSDYYTAYRYFEKNREERDLFLAAIIVKWIEKTKKRKNGETISFSDEFSWYLPKEHRKEMFLSMMHHSVMGFIHGFSAKMIADQFRNKFKKLIPKGIQGHDFDTEIEKIQGILLDTFRFRGVINDYLYTTLLPKLCIEPIIQVTSIEPMIQVTSPELYSVEKLRIDGKWIQDTANKRVITDPMARDAIGGVTDRNIFSGKSSEMNEKERWDTFLFPLIEERCHDLGIEDVVPGEELFKRLYTTNAVSRNGKPGRPVYEVEKPYTCWMETLDDVKKAIIYALVRHGENLVAVTRDSFIVEIPSEQVTSALESLKVTVCDVCEQILGLDHRQWGCFVETEILAHWPKDFSETDAITE